MTTVTVLTPIYGEDYDQFVAEWLKSLKALTRQPDEVKIHRGFARGDRYPQARILNEAMAEIETEWVWTLNVDDLALPDALDGIDDVETDVWLMGYRREDGRFHVPIALPNSAYLLSTTNAYPSMSAFRRSAWEKVGGYPEIGHEDWGFWRRLARAGCTFSSSGRVHSIYRQHPIQRTQTDLGDRDALLREVMTDVRS